MKDNYKVGDEVIVNKPGINNLPGTVLSNNKDINKPLSVILLDGMGTWQLLYSEVVIKDKQISLKDQNPTNKIKRLILNDENKVEKRGRKKHITA